jgi:hypothetical protein
MPVSSPERAVYKTDVNGWLQSALPARSQAGYEAGRQFNCAVPVTLGDVLLIPLFTVKFRSAGAVAVIVTCPICLHAALPVSLIEAVVLLELDQVRPSATVRSRLVLLVKVAVAVYCTSEGGVMGEVAVAGETVILVMVGCPAPQAIDPTTRPQMQSTCRALSFIGSPA